MSRHIATGGAIGTVATPQRGRLLRRNASVAHAWGDPKAVVHVSMRPYHSCLRMCANGGLVPASLSEKGVAACVAALNK